MSNRGAGLSGVASCGGTRARAASAACGGAEGVAGGHTGAVRGSAGRVAGGHAGAVRGSVEGIAGGYAGVVRASLPFALAPVNVIAGHYGVGKTNLALNVALDAAAAGMRVVLVDLDVVNPYFRSTEYRALLEEAGVRLIAPVFAEAGGSLDVPSLTGAVIPAIEAAYAAAAGAPSALSAELAVAAAPVEPATPATPAVAAAPVEPATPAEPSAPPVSVGRAASSASVELATPSASALQSDVVIIDAGGDDAGATALGRFARHIAQGPYAMFCVVNAFRNLTQDVASALANMREIESASRLRVTGVISNAHLKEETDLSTVARGLDFAREVAERAGVPLVCATVPKALICDDVAELTLGEGGVSLYPVSTYVKVPWE